MGARGPVPKRSTQRRRRNVTPPIDTVTSDGTMYGRDLQGDHSEQGERFWEALRTSGQAQFYEDSDWAVAELVVLAIDAFVVRPSAVMLASMNSMMGSLLVTEGDRRRARLELERGKPVADDPDSEVADLDDFRRRLSG